jgi:hypothetical protein
MRCQPLRRLAGVSAIASAGAVLGVKQQRERVELENRGRLGWDRDDRVGHHQRAAGPVEAGGFAKGS